MKIDLNARRRIYDEKKLQHLADSLKRSVDIKEQLKPLENFSTKDLEIELKLNANRLDKQLVLLMYVIGLLKKQVAIKTSDSIPFKLPELYKIDGKVDIRNIPPVEVKNAIEIKNQEDVEPYFTSLEMKIEDLAKLLEKIYNKKIDFPKIDFPKIEIPKPIQPKDNEKAFKQYTSEIAKGFSRLEQSLEKLQESIEKSEKKEIDFPTTISVDNFPPQMTPTPVTNFNINPLRGLVHPSSTTVSTTLTTLPGYGVLSNRRAIVFYNNGSNTVFIGGSNVTTSNGFPIPASTYSPAFDSGPTQIWYGVTSSSTSDVRCIEIQNDAGN